MYALLLKLNLFESYKFSIGFTPTSSAKPDRFSGPVRFEIETRI